MQRSMPFGELTGQGWLQLSELGLAFVLSALIGLEREFRQKSAGLHRGLRECGGPRSGKGRGVWSRYPQGCSPPCLHLVRKMGR